MSHDFPRPSRTSQSPGWLKLLRSLIEVKEGLRPDDSDHTAQVGYCFWLHVAKEVPGEDEETTRLRLLVAVAVGRWLMALIQQNAGHRQHPHAEYAAGGMRLPPRSSGWLQSAAQLGVVEMAVRERSPHAKRWPEFSEILQLELAIKQLDALLDSKNTLATTMTWVFRSMTQWSLALSHPIASPLCFHALLALFQHPELLLQWMLDMESSTVESPRKTEPPAAELG